MGRPDHLRKSSATLPAPQVEYLAKVDDILALPPIPGPKPWDDSVERAAMWHCTRASTPIMALCAAGVPKTTAAAWLTEEPPEGYRGACVALSERLKSAQEVCSQTLLGRIYAAADDPKHWTAAAWIMERSRGYVVQQQQLTGPSVVVNIGTVNIQKDELPRISWRDDSGAIQAESVAVVSSSED